jgi:hypothetical protein
MGDSDTQEKNKILIKNEINLFGVIIDLYTNILEQAQSYVLSKESVDAHIRNIPITHDMMVK